MFTGTVQAQDVASDWEVTVYIPNEAAIVTLSAGGETGRIAVSEQTNELLNDAYLPSMKLSPDHRWLAFDTLSPDGYQTGTISVADLQSKSCCQEFGVETELPDGTKPGIFKLVGFSPDSTELALVAEQYPQECGEGCFPTTSGIVVELATMMVSPVAQFVFGNESPLGWVEDGIAVAQHQPCLPGQMCMDPTSISWKVVRDITTGETLSSVPIVRSLWGAVLGDTLALTGEYISYHFYTEEEWNPYVLYSPVIVYFAPEMDSWSWSSKPTFIYHFKFPETPSEGDFMFMRWVLDGNAVLFRLHTEFRKATLLTRDGDKRTFDIPYYHEFLAGTPDGWLMYEADTGNDPAPEIMSFFHYRYDGDELTVSEVGSYKNNPKYGDIPALLDATPLGASVTKPFPTVELPKGIG